MRIMRTHAEGITSDYAHGRATSKHKLTAAKEVLTVFRDFSPLQCGSVVAGMYLLQDASSHRFASDKGFTFELVRRFRSLSDANVGLYENADSGRVRRAYREIPARTVAQLGAILVEGFKTFVAFVRGCMRGSTLNGHKRPGTSCRRVLRVCLRSEQPRPSCGILIRHAVRSLGDTQGRLGWR